MTLEEVAEQRLTRAKLDQLRANYDPEPTASWSLPAECYVDPEFEAIESDAIFRRSWQFVSHSESVSTAGDFITDEVGGHPIMVIRGEDDKLRAFYNVCQHRGHELLTGSGSKRAIVCPYHAWTYRLDGGLANARRSELVADFNPDDFCLTAIRVEEFCSLVFVNLDPGASPLAAHVGTLGEEIQSYAPDLSSLTHAHRLTYRIKANWKTVIDNFLECYHCEIAHRDFVSLVDMSTYQVTTNGIWSSHHAKAGTAENSAYAVADATVTDHAVWWLWPNQTLMRYPGRGNFMVWRMIPAGPEETYEVFDFYFETAELTDAEIQAIAYIDEVLQVEDIGLVESVQRGMRTPGFVQSRYMTDAALPDGRGSGLSEHGVHHFHGLVLDAYSRALEATNT